MRPLEALGLKEIASPGDKQHARFLAVTAPAARGPGGHVFGRYGATGGGSVGWDFLFRLFAHKGIRFT